METLLINDGTAPVDTAIPSYAERLSDEVSTTEQNRIRYDLFVTMGHEGTYFEFQCHPQTSKEVATYGLRTSAVFADRVRAMLQEPRITAERRDIPLSRTLRDRVHDFLLSLDDGVSRDVQFRIGPVRISGRTVCGDWRSRI